MTKLNSMKNNVKLSFGEEIGNSVSHGAFAAILLFLLPAIAVYSYIKGGVILSIGTSIFIISVFLMLFTSCIYHVMPFDTKHKYVMRIIDHSMIFVAIAGSYTPIALYILGGVQGIVILIIQWTMVICGILYKAIARKANPKVTLIIYLTMGWIAVFIMPSLLSNSNPIFLSLIVLGGILYSAGTWFYSKKDTPYFHFIWHIFVDLALLSHIIAIVFFI